MANSSVAKKDAAPEVTTISVLAPAIGWLIPGAGHLIQKRWVRGVLLMVSIGAMFITGLMMNGRWL